jgi:Tfp pilus assembly protein PilO
MFGLNFSKISISDLKRYTKFIIIFIVILLLVGGYFIWWPKYQEFRQSSINLDAESEKVKKKKDYILEMETSLNNVSGYQEEISKISSALPLEYSVSSLFSLVQKTASENGLVISMAEISTVPKTSNQAQAESTQIAKIGVSVTITGSYSSFENFLSTLYRNSRLVEVSSIAISNEEQPNEELTNIYDFDLEIYAYYYNKTE